MGEKWSLYMYQNETVWEVLLLSQKYVIRIRESRWTGQCFDLNGCLTHCLVHLMSYSFTNLEILEILELSYQFIMFFAEMFRKMPETVLYALMPNVTRFFFINNIINQKYLVSGILPNISAKNIINW